MHEYNESEAPISRRNAAIYTDSKITLDSLKNDDNHKHLIEEIRTTLKLLVDNKWNVQFGWVKAHIGIRGNKIADTLAKQATRDGLQESYKRIPLSEVKTQLQARSREL